MLFDLLRDPSERHNLVDRQPELSAALAAELDAWRSARPRPGGSAPSTTELDPTTEKQLKALGYLD